MKLSQRLGIVAGLVLCGCGGAWALSQTITQPPADVSALIPAPCSAPAADTLLGSAGAANCMAQTTATRPTAVQSQNTTLNADCTWTATFSVRPFTSATPIVHAEAILPPGSTQPLPCNPTSRSTTVQSGRCFPLQAPTLAAITIAGISAAVGGQVVNVVGSSCTPGTPIMVWGREPTQ